MKERVNSLKKVIDNSGNKEYYSVADVKGDVKKDISYSGKQTSCNKILFFKHTLAVKVRLI